ncbi:MAG: hypothetical protein LBV27_06765, partial [Oscillospiraceae bacterium]|jgi:hypothetical protein|nr:hypothetical protein [Oscillospiraceae bacterium]
LGAFNVERVLPRAYNVTAGIETTRCGASTFYSRPQNREKTIITMRALCGARGSGFHARHIR